jgi:hypothetical protein
MDQKHFTTNSSNNKENVEIEHVPKLQSDSNSIGNISLQRNKLFYENKRKLSGSLNAHRSLNRVSSDHNISFSRYIQSNIRKWGAEVPNPKKGSQL